MKKYLILLIPALFALTEVAAQGCVAIRSTGAVCTRESAAHAAKGWQLTTSYRFFKSFRHFVGEEEQKERMEKNTEVINWSHALTFSLSKNLTNRWSLTLDVPVLYNERSSLYEHGGNNGGPAARHTTKSFGIGDIRVAAYHWLLDPVKHMRGNIQLGLGLKLPTGDYQYQGFTAEMNAYYNFSRSVGVYTNLYYLINPREHNGTSTARGGAPSATALAFNTATMSVPDQFMSRIGANFNVRRFGFSLGGRIEGIPAKDLIGGNGGFRRPGYVIGIEPGVNYTFKKLTAFATVPVALERNRTQSVADKARSAATGNYVHGDAAFADYVVNMGLTFKF
jgi:hypothetical protein